MKNIRVWLRNKKYQRKYQIGNNVRFGSKDVLLYGEGTIIIGDNTYFGNYLKLQSIYGCEIKIGRRCAISHNVSVYTCNYDSKFDLSLRKLKRGNVEIGNNCWIGINSVILQGIKIGNNVVIGANSVVNRNIRNNLVCQGVPVKGGREKF